MRSRNTVHGVYMANSHGADVYENRLILNGEKNIALFLDGSRGHDSRDNFVHDNFVNASNAVLWANHLAASITCSNVPDGCVAAADSKNNRFAHNIYDIPNVSGGFFYFKGKHRTWSEWQATGWDTTGSVL